MEFGYRVAATVAAATVCALAAAGPVSATGSARVVQGSTQVEMRWTGMRAAPTSVVLKVRTGRVVSVYRGLQRGGWGIPIAGRLVDVRDLDDDGRPEVLADLTSGGITCCLRTHIVRWDATARRHRVLVHRWGAGARRAVDLGRDGRTEFLTADDRLRLDVPTPAVRMPLRISAYRDGAIVDVTPDFPGRVRADMGAHFAALADLERAGAPTRAAVAAYLADAARLGEGPSALARLRAAHPAAARDAVLDTIRRRLAALGYPSLDQETA